MSDVIGWGEWKPDVSVYKGSHSPTITNVVPQGDGYGPFKSFAAMSDALPGACRGFFTALDDDGTISLFAGTADTLQKMSNSDFSWTEVSVSDGTYTVPASNQWQFAQFGTRVIAVNGSNNVQSYVMGSSSDFANLGGNPPTAKYVSVINQFVVLSGLSSDPYSIQWSSRSDPTEWTAGTNEGDTQTFDHGGLVRGVAGGEYGLVFQDHAIRRMTYSPGSAVIFEFDIVSENMGLLAPYSIVKDRDFVFFLSEHGFCKWHPAEGFTPIGREKVDRTFFRDWDDSSKHLMIGLNDPKASRVVWFYKSIQGEPNVFDRAIVYDWVLDRWSGFVNVTGQYAAILGTPGITLENLDSINSSIDALATSLDDFPTDFGLNMGIANSSHIIGNLAGSNMEATLETADIVGDRRMFVRAQRPVTDAATVYGSVVALRQRADESPTFGAESVMNQVGFCPHRADSRLVRFRNRIPAGEDWSYSSGIEPDMVPSGMR